MPFTPQELTAWLAAQRAAYRAEPERARDQLPAMLVSGAHSLEAARFAAQLALECRDPRTAQSLVQQWLDTGGLEAGVEAELRSHLARALIQQQRFDGARAELDRAEALAEAAPLARALIQAARAQLAHREAEMQRAAQLAAQALQGFQALDWDGPGVQTLGTRALALRALGESAARAEALAQGCELASAQRRWGESALFACGQFDQALEEGDAARAQQALQRAGSLAARELGAGSGPGQAMLSFSRARWLAFQGRHREACAGLREALARQQHRLAPHELALRLDQLADWLVEAGEPVQALETALEAQALQRRVNEQVSERGFDLLRQHLAVEQAERERAASETHARRLEEQQARLERTLQRQHALHDELIEARKLAGLGQLLTGLSRSLEAPLQLALDGLQHSQLGGRQALERVQSGQAIGRGELRQTLQASLDACATAQQQLEQALAAVSTYQSLRDEPA